MEYKNSSDPVSSDSQDDWNLPQKQQTKPFVYGGILNSTNLSKKLIEQPTIAHNVALDSYRDSSVHTSNKYPFEESLVLSSTSSKFKISKLAKNCSSSQLPNLIFSRGQENYCLELDLAFLKLSPISFGRSSVITLHHPSSSRHHAYISIGNSKDKTFKIEFFITDLNSSNGTFLNGGKLPPSIPTKIADNNEITFGLSEDIICFKDPLEGNYKINLQFTMEDAVPNKRSYDKITNSSDQVITKTSVLKAQPIPSLQHSDTNPQRIRCRHILKKHVESRNPFDSFRKVKITRTKAKAKEEISIIRKKLETQPMLFTEIASAESECSSAKNGGDLGFFSKGQMQKAFEEAAFLLKVGEMSREVESSSGIHIIFRIE